MSDLITPGYFQRRLFDLCIRSAPLGGGVWPRRQRDRHILLKSIVLTMDVRREYTEREVDALIVLWLAEVGRAYAIDYVILRRRLVDEGYLGRERDGSRYWVGALPPRDAPFDTGVDDVDVHEAIRAGMALVARRKQAHFRRGLHPQVQ